MNYQIPKNQLEDNLSKYYDYISVDHDLILFKDVTYPLIQKYSPELKVHAWLYISNFLKTELPLETQILCLDRFIDLTKKGKSISYNKSDFEHSRWSEEHQWFFGLVKNVVYNRNFCKSLNMNSDHIKYDLPIVATTNDWHVHPGTSRTRFMHWAKHARRKIVYSDLLMVALSPVEYNLIANDFKSNFDWKLISKQEYVHIYSNVPQPNKLIHNTNLLHVEKLWNTANYVDFLIDFKNKLKNYDYSDFIQS